MTRDLGSCIPGKFLEGLDVGKRGISTILKVYWVLHPCVGSWKSRTVASQEIANDWACLDICGIRRLHYETHGHLS
jgi:hypothetical protein